LDRLRVLVAGQCALKRNRLEREYDIFTSGKINERHRWHSQKNAKKWVPVIGRCQAMRKEATIKALVLDSINEKVLSVADNDWRYSIASKLI
jgi:hypothetical protein